MRDLLSIGTSRGCEMIGTGIGLGLSGYTLARNTFKPDLISGLQLWLDASDSTTLLQSSGGSAATADGDPVGYWADKSGNGRNATQTDGTKKPALKINVQGGKGSVLYDGSNDALVIAGSSSSLKFLHGTNSSIFIVLKNLSAGVGNILISNGGSSAQTGLALWVSSSTILNEYITNSSGAGVPGSVIFNASSTSYVPPSFFLATYINTPAESPASNRSFGYKNGASSFNNNTATGSVSLSNSTSDLSVGESTFSGYISEILLYNSALSASNKANIENYLMIKWGV